MAGSGFERRALSAYEHRGDPDAGVSLTAADHRRQRDYEVLVEAVERSLKEHPAPPPSEEMRARLQAILASTVGREHELMRWRMRLYCGHLVERTAHGSHLTLHAAFMNHTTCPTCRSELTIVAAKPLGYTAESPAPAPPPVRKAQVRPKRPTRTELDQRIAELERENAQLRARS